MKKTFVFNTEIEKLWNFLRDIETYKLWMEGVVNVKYVEPKDKSHTTAYILTIEEGKNNYNDYYGYIHTEEKPNKLITISQNENFICTTKYILSSHNNATILEYSSEFLCYKLKHKIIFGLIGGLFSRIMIKKFIKNLKHLVEKN